ncbi:hypothetical protein MPTK1_5g17000 [Marchantia polymorpha subsp. ruderalis]|uniref:UspA domain-containing protein n=2 Tax=Marchantia polymorpha TaxID=3197 RepID=A0AAF6BJ75_MARPO|nr:hypothetical protein MARPO_0117s0006 [Marchantia polymorpha]BBN12059.1 hypothetical protein Mp_5g17000 [Marchantia polymorpha subsp. ruderalis]|eukprot:PTQ30924.1 hypothetical protein MARPO_0117s0006 [Marchantia polymorpha]
MTLGAIPESRAPPEYELEREEKFVNGRLILLAVDHGPNSRKAFNWALKQFVTQADELHLLHVLPKSSGTGVSCTSPTSGSRSDSPVYEATQVLFQKLAKEAYDIARVRVVPVLRDGDAGKEICAEAARLQPVAVIMGSRGLGLMKSLLIGSATEYCTHHCPVPLVIVPHNYASGDDCTPDELRIEDTG